MVGRGLLGVGMWRFMNRKSFHFLQNCILSGWLLTFGGLVATSQAQYGGTETLPPPPSPPGGSGLAIQDPYMVPADTSRPLFENPPSNPFSSYSSQTTEPVAGTRLFQNFGADFTWITPKAGQKQMGLFRIDVAGDIAFPICASQDRPLLLEPRFAINWWNGPQSNLYDMASSTFDASLGLRWMPQWKLNSMATALEFDLFFSVGIYSDFKKVTGESFRFPSWAYVSLDFTKTIKGKIGIWYLDRVRYKIFPSGGIIWSPNSQWEFQILFPNPRVTYRPVGGGFRDMNLYARGEYGGGSWTVQHLVDGNCRTDYNDYRIMFGLDWANKYRSTGYFEIGVAFGRELYFADARNRNHSYSLDAGFIMQAGLHF